MVTRKVSFSLLLAVLLVGGLGVAIFLMTRDDGGVGDGGENAEKVAAPKGEPVDPVGEGEPAPAVSGAEEDAGAGEGAEDTVAAEPVDDRPVAVTGRILDPEGEGIAGATVIAVDSKEWGEHLRGAEERFNDPFTGISALAREYREKAAALEKTESGEDGRYELRGLAPGTYGLFVTHIDHRPARSEGVEVDAEATAKRDVTMQPGETISGVVLDADDKPVEGALITCVTDRRANARGMGDLMQTLIEFADARFLLGGEVRSAADGSFRLSSLEPVFYEVRAKREGFAPAKVGKVPAGTQDIVVLLSPGSTVVGRVVDAEGEPVPDADVELRIARPNLSRMNPMTMGAMDIDFLGEKTLRSKTDAEEGRFSIVGATSGVRDLVVRSAGHQDHTTRVLIDEASVDLGDITLPPERSISGMVLGPDGYGVEGVEVSAFPEGHSAGSWRSDESTVVARAETDTKGRFTLAALVEGSYNLRAKSEDHPTATAEVVEAGREDVTLTLKSGVTVRGVVLSARDREPIAGVRVSSYGAGRRSAETNDDGEFELRGVDVSRGSGSELNVRASHPEFGSQWKSVPVSADKQVEILLTSSVGARGVVLDASGEPVAGARVKVRLNGMPEIFMQLAQGGGAATTSDEHGRFELGFGRIDGPPVPPEIVATHPRHGRGTYVIPRDEYEQLQRSRRTVSAEPGAASDPAPIDDIEIVLGRGAVITGRVFDTNGGVVPRARLEAKSTVEAGGAEAQLVMQMFGSGEGVVGYSADDGSYRIEGLDAGTWTVEATAIGYARWRGEPTDVPAESEVSLDVTLDAGGVVTGKVVDHVGETLAGVEVVALPQLEIGEAERDRYQAQMMVQVQQVTSVGVARTRTNERGEYELTHLPEGTFTIAGRLAEYHSGAVADVEAGDQVDDIVLSAYSQLRGVVRERATGAPVTSYALRFDRAQDGRGAGSRMWRNNREEVTDSEGRFDIDELLDGQYTLRVESAGHVPTIHKVTVAPGELQTVELFVDQGAALRGVVTDLATGEPISRAQVSLQPKDRQQAQELGIEGQWKRSGDDGMFSFGAVADATYTVSASHETYYVEGPGVEVTVVDRQPVEVELKMRLGGRVRGQFEAPDAGDERTWYIVELESAEPPAEDGAPGNEVTADAPRAQRRTYTGWARPGNQYSVGGLPPGAYRLRVSKRRMDDGSSEPPVDQGEVEVRAGEVVELDIDLR